MKKLFVIIIIASVAAGVISCSDKRSPGRTYMPDMWYSRAYEAYQYNTIDGYERLKERGVNYSGLPVAGTVARDDQAFYPFPANDSGYALSANYRNPYDTTVTGTAEQIKEGQRLYLIYCGICHGTNLDGNGPLWKGGDGPYPAAPRNLKDDYSKGLSDGTMYHVITYGKGQMGAYNSQVKPVQRWWIINYIRQQQGGGTAAAGAAATDTTAAGAAGTAAPAAGGGATATGAATTTNQ